MKVKILNNQLINQIAAGEVVERPLSVVRELTDNAVDAQAENISVFLENGGQTLIRIVDDGFGMSPEDAVRAFDRHATSKIVSLVDLQQVGTLGFRGEALAAIGAVAKTVLITRTAEAEAGTKVSFADGTLQGTETVAAPLGTDIEVRSLFYNTPARRKFLKQPSTEQTRIKNWLSSYAIARPQVRFRLFFDGREILNLTPSATSRERAALLMPDSTVVIEELVGAVRIEGLFSHPSAAQRHSNSLHLFVNGRMVTDRLLIKAIRDGYQSTLREREFPVGFLALELPPGELDVNVHPQKSEIRFRSSQQVFTLVRGAVRKAVNRFVAPLSSESIASSGQQAGGHFTGSSGPLMGQALAAATNQPLVVASQPTLANFLLEGSAKVENLELGTDFRYANLRFIGEAFACYLFCEGEESLYLIDMHAAHERINYNKIKTAFLSKSRQSQTLLIPHAVTLSIEGLQNIVDNQHLLQSFGFEFEVCGQAELSVTSVPTALQDADLEGLFRELAQAAFDDTVAELYEQSIDKLCARLACHSSIRSGKELNRTEVYALLTELDQAELGSACPHGRPVAISFSKNKLDSWFGRDR